MFHSATAFNQPVAAWDVGQVIDMSVRLRPLLRVGLCVNLLLAGWLWKQHVTCAGAAQYMFRRATAFNQPVEAWDVGQVINMRVRRRLLLGVGRHASLLLAGWL